MRTLWGDLPISGTLRITSAQELFITAASLRTGAALTAAELPVSRLELAPQQEDFVQSIAAVQTSAATTRLSLTALLPSSSAEVQLLDADGNELASRPYAGITGEFSIPLSDLASSELAFARLAVRVTAGRILPVLVVSATDGSSVRYSPLSPVSLPASTLLVPAATPATVLRLGASGGEALDLRIRAFSASGESAGDPVALKSPADAILEARDLPASNLALESATPLTALDAATLRAPLTLAPAGDHLTLPAAGAGTHLTLLAGPSGATASVSAYDASGALLSSTDPIALAPFASLSQTLDPLLPAGAGAALRLELEILDGSLAAQSTLPVEGAAEPLVHAAQAASTSACPAPIVSFSAESSTLSWSVRNADAILVSAAPGELQPMIGSLAVKPSSTTEYTLEATGSCGMGAAQATVYVGSPVLAKVEPASGLPGQAVRLTLSNAESWVDLAGIVWTLSDGRTVAAEIVASDALSATIRVPLALMASSPAATYSGSARITLNATGASATGLPFTILALPAATDSIAGFRQAIEAVAASSAARLAALLDAGAPDASIQPLQRALDAELAQMRKALDDIAATGRATVALSAPSTAVPQPATFTLTRQDLDTAWALFRSAQAELPAESASLNPLAVARAASGRPQAADGDRWDILRDPTYKLCLDAKLNETRAILDRNVIDTLYDLLGDLLSTLADVTGLDKIPMAAWTKKMIEISSKPEYWCNLYPIKLATFYARPYPNPIPGYDYRESGPLGLNAGTELYASLIQVWTKEEAADALVAILTKKITDKAEKKMEKLPENEREALMQAIKKMLDDAYQAAREQVAAVVGALGLTRVSQDRLVYKANLDRVEPDSKRNRPKILKRDSREMGLESLYPDDARYGLSGVYNPEKPRGGTVPLAILRFPKHFYDPDSTSTYYEVKGNRPLWAYTPVTVKSREKEVTVESYQVTSVTSRPPSISPRTLLSADGSKAFGPLKLSGSRNYGENDCRLGKPCTRSSAAIVSARRTGPSTYLVSASFKSTGERFPGSGQNLANIGVSAFTPRVLGSKQHIRVTCTVNSSNLGPNSVLAGRTSGSCSVTTTTLDGSSNTTVQLAADFGATSSRSQVIDVPNGFLARVTLTGSGDGNGSTDVTAKIELLDK
ncbi:MAG: hypothetical protein HY821_20685 [Acidobacteria bacterium]|nr:hypothetical protein [Acidobacteriota bacterium]